MAKKILIIEDDNSIGKMYKAALTDHGYAVDWDTSSEKAGERLKTQSDYDLILLDLLLPVKSGLQFLEEIKKQESPLKHIPVYILTNVKEPDAMEKGISLGANGYFLKLETKPKQLAEEIDHFFTSRES